VSETPGGIAPPGTKLIGVSRVVPHAQVKDLSPSSQDSLIRDVLNLCEADLKGMVGGIQPVGPLSATVTGPHDDTLQGPIHVHTVAGYFRTDDLPRDSHAYVLHVTGGPDGNGVETKVTEGE